MLKKRSAVKECFAYCIYNVLIKCFDQTETVQDYSIVSTEYDGDLKERNIDEEFNKRQEDFIKGDYGGLKKERIKQAKAFICQFEYGDYADSLIIELDPNVIIEWKKISRLKISKEELKKRFISMYVD